MWKLTDKSLRSLGPGRHNDGLGLYIQVGPNGARAWVFRYKIGGKPYIMGLGGYPVVSLAEARNMALDLTRRVRGGINPMAEKKALQSVADAGKAPKTTFQIIAEKYIAAHKAGWSSPVHAAQWPATLKKYAYPKIGDSDVNNIDVAEILEILEPIWVLKPETASRVRGRIEAVLDYAKVLKLRSGDNPARWTGHLDHLLPSHSKVTKVEHHAAMPWRSLSDTLAALTVANGPAAPCVRFIVFTACRSNEARGATWGEIDLKKSVWVIPAERMKADKEHRVPLSSGAMAVLRSVMPLDKQITAETLVFPGGVEGKPLTDTAVSRALHNAGGTGFTIHGMRSTFRDWAAEETDVHPDLCEVALAHSVGSKVAAAYLRSDMFEKRRVLMESWAGAALGGPSLINAA